MTRCWPASCHRVIVLTLIVEQTFDLGNDHIDRDCVHSAIWNDNVSVAFRGLYKIQMHRAHRFKILVNHRLNGAPPAARVALDAPDDAQIALSVDKNLGSGRMSNGTLSAILQ